VKRPYSVFVGGRKSSLGLHRRERGVDEAVDGPIVLTPSLGGSLPLYIFSEILNAPPIVVVPIANHDNNQHAPNENLRIKNLWLGIEIYAALMALL
jgi:acetylornithine deacetylase/succinyl-diaminopimelate desuccinylase-like protein